jgi:hypothetical protein
MLLTDLALQDHKTWKTVLELLKDTCRCRLQALGVPAFSVLVSAQREEKDMGSIEGDNAIATILWTNAMKDPEKWKIIGEGHGPLKDQLQ